ncbi:NotI family restriction endonuclease [Bifidobacterium catenulatum subsp. kashiwanohense]|uniref:NotI family restriction endonuclease n=1 Tax=Bifidobacterium catenulatum TaxID=1686 RepID=UPI003CFDABAF
MAGTIVDFFGYRAEDNSETALSAVARNLCPFIHDTCNKTLGRDGTCSGVCAVRQVSSNQRIICCPIRLYADDYRILHIIAQKTFGVELNLYSGRAAVAKAVTEGGAVAVFGHRWGGELRLPKRNGVGNYFADWVLAHLDESGQLKEFTSIEVQTIDTTGNYRASRAALIDGRRVEKSTVGLNWENVSKRIIPQLVYKGQVLQREPLCRSGLWFVTPESVYSRIIDRLGGDENMAFGYAPQPGALHFLRYDYDETVPMSDGTPTVLKVIGDSCTTVEQVQSAFNRVRLPEAGVYGNALKEALYG